MKTKLLFSALLLLSINMYARTQDTVKVSVLGKNLVTVVEAGSKTDVKIGDHVIDVKDDKKDTVKIRVGRKTMVISEGHHGTSVKYDKLNDEEFKHWTGHDPKFKGHWSTLELGVNTFSTVDYKGYAVANFMDLNQNKSLEVNINLLKYSISLQKKNNDIGLVTGLGLNFNDYRFSNNYTIKNNMGYTVPVAITDPKLEMSKLSTGFLTVPLLLEFQLPRESGFWVSFGVIAGLKMGSHTKVIIDRNKTKDHSDFNINPFRGGTTVRMGYKKFNIFGTYYYTPLFRDGRGPVMDPITVGIGLLN
jgi:hypothetical protein